MFHNDFNCAEDVFRNFNVSDDEQQGVHFLYANYTYEDYSGAAGVIFVKNGKFFLVTGSHCSCYGLEDQWSPEEITLLEMRHYASNRAAPYGVDFQGLVGILERLEEMGLDRMTDKQIQMYLKLAL